MGPFSELFDAVAAVSREITSAAQTATEQSCERLVAHSHSIVDVATAEEAQYLASVIMCFDTDPADTTGELVGTVLNLGPFATVRAATDAASGEAEIGCYLMFEREQLAFAGMSHSISSQLDVSGRVQFHVTAAVTYRSADPPLQRPTEPATQQAADHPPPPQRKLKFRPDGNKARRTALYRHNKQ
ncbi:hypothetical protein LX13_003967 [Williamsia maris]|uniref:Uncharacterized protein n=1 Tax=Williamsia maris TaxID=72806 RepID=A0ABT1HJK8_9NOCA|nr:hypothetical protein [Williamsia maris]